MPEVTAVFELLSHKHAPGDLRVVKFRGVEAMSRTFRFDVVVRSEGAFAQEIARDLVGQRARLVIGGETARVVRGVASEVEATGRVERSGERTHRVRIVPHFAFLRRTQRSRIFQERSVPDIVSAVLSGANVAHEFRLSSRYLPRVYCVQYQESDLAFVERLLAEEGIFYWFEHEQDPSREILVLSDTPEQMRSIEGGVLQHREHGSGQLPEDDLLSFSSRTRVRTGRVEVRHWDFLRPGFRVPGVAEERGADIDFDERTLEVYEHQAEADDFDASSGAARIKLEELRARRDVASAESRSRRPLPGRVFDLKSDIAPEAEGLYSIVRVEHEGTNPEYTRIDERADVYRNRILASPARSPVRPRRRRRRVQQAMETATVVGPSGREIHTDEHGRIRVRFHWDREAAGEEPSCWIRTMQSWSGAAWGSQFIPRVGMEVVVMFVGGDVDRPLVIGCVPNVTQPMPFALPRHKTKSGIKTQSSPGGGSGHNELSFEDRTGFEKVYVHAEKDMHVDVNHDLLETVHHNATQKVDHSSYQVVAHQRIVSVGGDDTHAVGGDRRSNVGGDVSTRIEGSEEHRVVRKALFKVGEALETSVGSVHRHDVQEELLVTAREGIVARSDAILAVAGPGGVSAMGARVDLFGTDDVSIRGGQSIELICGDSRILMSPDQITIASPSIVLDSSDAVCRLADGVASLQGDSGVVLKSSDVVSLFSSAASLVLRADAKLDGGQVKLKAPASPEDDPTRDAPEPTTIELVDDEGNPVPNERYRVVLPNGRILSGATDADGKARVRFQGDAKIVFPDLGRVQRA